MGERDEPVARHPARPGERDPPLIGLGLGAIDGRPLAPLRIQLVRKELKP